MISLDREWLERLGLADLSDDDARELLSAVYNELEVRVSEVLGSEMTDAQLDEFDAITDQAAAIAWLAENLPDYQKVVTSEVAKIEAETREKAPEILAALKLPETN